MKTLSSFISMSSLLGIAACGIIPNAFAMNDNSLDVADDASLSASPEPRSQFIEVITVSATGSQRNINEIAANVASISGQQIDQMAASNIRDVLRYEPGVSVEGSGRFGLEGFNIRGINGDRILILVDGVPIADEFSFGPNLSSRRDFVDIDLLQSIEIIRGPASTLYGSDAIGGVVSLISKDPSELVEQGESFAGRVKLNYASQSDESSINTQLAGLSGKWQALLAGGVRQSNETQTYFDDDAIGSQRKSADPQDNRAENALFKLIYTPNIEHRFSVNADYFTQSSDTELLSAVGEIVRGAVNISDLGEDARERSRVSLDYVYTPQPNNYKLKRIALNAFSQNSETEQISLTTRKSLQADNQRITDRTRESRFLQDVVGLRLQLDHEFGDEVQHYLIYGFESTTTDSESLRTSFTLDATSGEVQPEFSIFPARDFPISELQEYAVFIQNEISFFDGLLRLSPGIRFDQFTLTPNSDDIFANANPGVEIVEFDDSELSAKIGTVYQISEDINVWAQYSEGFRIPPMDDVNIGFTNFAGGYTSLANPNLKPESVVSYEVGVRGSYDAFEWSISYYFNEYENFIESLATLGFNPQTRLLEFQAINIEDVEISGVDISASWFIGESFQALQGFEFNFATSTQQSEDKSTGQALDSILPTQTVLGLRYGSLDDKWHAELISTFTGQANALANENDQAFFRADSYTLIDVVFHYQISDSLRLNAGIFNITDEQYWLASEVRGQPQDADLSRLSASGRNMSANLIWQF